jgi:hypothetical protein
VLKEITMGRKTLIFLFNNLVCLNLIAQKASERSDLKPAPDACPTWDNKQTVAKADYFLSLRTTSKTLKTNEYSHYNQTNKNFDKPLYAALVKRTNNDRAGQEPETLQINNEISTSKKTKEELKSIPSIPFQTTLGMKNNDSQSDLKLISEERSEKNNTGYCEQEEKNSTTEKMQLKKKNKFFNLHKSERKHPLKKIMIKKKHAAGCPNF